MFSQFNSLGSIVSHVENAVSEVAYSYPDEFPELVKRARKQGVRDIPGWLADELYNDADMVNETTTSGSYVTTNSSITLTPQSSSSRFFIMLTFQGGNNTTARRSYYRIFYNGGELSNSAMNHEFTNSATSVENPSALSVYHSPNTTSSVTYDVRFHSNAGGDVTNINYKNLSIFEFAN